MAVFEASDDLGGQWHTTAAHSGVWPGMHTNTSRAMTAFSDFAAPEDLPLHPAAEQIHAYLRAYADNFDVTERIRLHTPVEHVSPTWTVDGEQFDGVIVASGRFRKPRLPPGLGAFDGEVIHAFDYPGAAALPQPPHARLRERDQRPRDRIGSRAPDGRGLGLSQAPLRDPEGRERRVVGLAVVHRVRGARASHAFARGVQQLAPRPRASGRRRSRRVRSARARPRHPHRGICPFVRTTSARSRTARSSAVPRSPRSTAAP